MMDFFLVNALLALYIFDTLPAWPGMAISKQNLAAADLETHFISPISGRVGMGHIRDLRLCNSAAQKLQSWRELELRE